MILAVWLESFPSGTEGLEERLKLEILWQQSDLDFQIWSRFYIYTCRLLDGGFLSQETSSCRSHRVEVWTEMRVIAYVKLYTERDVGHQTNTFLLYFCDLFVTKMVAKWTKFFLERTQCCWLLKKSCSLGWVGLQQDGLNGDWFWSFMGQYAAPEFHIQTTIFQADWSKLVSSAGLSVENVRATQGQTASVALTKAVHQVSLKPERNTLRGPLQETFSQCFL